MIQNTAQKENWDRFNKPARLKLFLRQLLLALENLSPNAQNPTTIDRI
jgi:hypothetical protein